MSIQEICSYKNHSGVYRVIEKSCKIVITPELNNDKLCCLNNNIQVIKTFSTREGWWYIGIKGDGGVKSKGTRLLIEKEK